MAARLSLTIVSTDGVLRRPLPPEGEVSIGRGPDSFVVIADARVSRCHAVVRVGEACELVDMGGRNGVVLNGRRLGAHESVPFVVGDMVTIGAAVITLHAVARATRVWSQAEFESKVHEARAQAKDRGRPLCLGELRFDPGAPPPRAATTVDGGVFADVAARATILEDTLADLLRPSDVVALRAPGVYGLLLVETRIEAARELGERVRRRLREHGFDVELEVHADGAASERAVGGGLAFTPMLERIAAGSINVLVLGETGVGKEVMARELHARSPRSKGPIVCLNCAAFSESLLEGELFGYEKGAFTGAASAKAGLLEAAQGGTLFLDEVGEMPLSLQAKLLRVLEQREVLRIGALKPRPIDARFVAATNRDLAKEIAEGRFREDLYFRLNGISLTIPPLRERPADIEPLALRFLAATAADAKRAVPPALTPQAVVALRAHTWPGNVRELKNVIERAFLLAGGEAIKPEHLQADRGALASVSAPAPARPEARADYERARIAKALEACGGNQSQAAKLLGVSRRTLITWMEQHDFPRPRKRPS